MTKIMGVNEQAASPNIKGYPIFTGDRSLYKNNQEFNSLIPSKKSLKRLAFKSVPQSLTRKV